MITVLYKTKNAASACSRIHNQNNVLFAPSLLKIRARRFGLCLYSHNYFEQKMKRVYFVQFTYVSRSYVIVRTWKNDHATRLSTTPVLNLTLPNSTIPLEFDSTQLDGTRAYSNKLDPTLKHFFTSTPLYWTFRELKCTKFYYARGGGGGRGVRTSRLPYPALLLPVPSSATSRPSPCCSRPVIWDRLLVSLFCNLTAYATHVHSCCFTYYDHFFISTQPYYT